MIPRAYFVYPGASSLMIQRHMRTYLLSFLCLFVLRISTPNQAVAQQSIQLKNGSVELFSAGMLGAGKAAQEAENESFHSFAQTVLYQGEYHLVVQFDDILTSDERRELEVYGVLLDQYIPPNGYVSRVSRNIELSELTEYGLNGYGRTSIGNKISRSFLTFLENEKSGRISIRASFSSQLSTREVQDAISLRSDLTGIKVIPAAAFFTAELTPDEIFRVARLPFVQAIEPHSESFSVESVAGSTRQDEGAGADFHVPNIRANVVKSELNGRLGLSGAGVFVGVGDVVYQGDTHVDMRGRHTILDPGLSANGNFSQHGNHTSGTVGGDGALKPRFEGLAPKSSIYSMRLGYGFSIGLEQPSPMVISSNSWNNSDPDFGDWYEQKGRYNIYSQSIDELLRTETELLSVFSAGNSGGTQQGYPEDYLMLNPSFGAAKNTMVVGRYGNPVFVSITPSFGPARDGRVKPDVVAQNHVHSGVAFNQYATSQGSSQSTPAVSGAAALLYEHYRSTNGGDTPDGGLIKAVIMNTADYIFEQGPSYAAGYGLVNTRRAADLISSSQFQKSQIEHGSAAEVAIEVPSSIDGKPVAQLKVMLYWIDKEASPYAHPALVNNLDLIVSDGAIDHQPWVLDSTRANVALPASRGIDTLNNTEQVAIDFPTAGTYMATITGTSVPFGPQEFYLVYSYVLDELLITYPLGDDKLFSGQNKVVFWDTHHVGAEREADDAEYSLDGGTSWTSFYGGSFSVRSNAALIVPESELTEALIRVTQGGRVAISEPFTISEQLTISQDESGSGESMLVWNEVLGAASYELLQLSETNEWEVIESLPDTSIVIGANLTGTRSAWMSVRAVNSTETIRSQRADAVHYVSSNTLPVAIGDVVNTPLDSRVTIDVLANDSDLDGDTIYIKEVTSASHGSVLLADNQEVKYTPESGYAGLDTFDYTIVDGYGGSATGTVTVSVASGVSTEESSMLPTEFRLEVNYPNPFNPSTTFRYALPVASRARVTVYDALGRQVALLSDSHLEAGWHTVTFEAGSLSSGMYFYRLEASDFNLSRAMLLIK